MKKIFYTAFYFCSTLLMSSCIGDLDQYPHEEETSSTIYTSAANYKAVLGKIYAAMVTTGQEKNGDNDLSSLFVFVHGNEHRPAGIYANFYRIVSDKLRCQSFLIILFD